MESARILIAMGSDMLIGKLKPILIDAGYAVIDQAKDGYEALRKTKALRPDIVILDYTLPLSNGYEIAKVIIEDKVSEVILIATDAQKSLVDPIDSDYSFVCMGKPLNKSVFTNTIDLMVKNRRKIRALEKEIDELKGTLDTRKEVERAKGLLMKHLKLTESEAFKRIQKQSMDRGIPMKDIAKAIILAYEI